MRPGDFLLTHRHGILPNLITLAERRRFGPHEAHWSHAALVVDYNGTLVEAETLGVQQSPLARYTPREYRLVRTGGLLSAEGRQAVVAYAQSQVGKAFGILVMLSLGAWLMTGRRVYLEWHDHQVCSSLVAHALTLGGIDVGGDPTFLLPADLARHFGL